jgi:hypothetical protein
MTNVNVFVEPKNVGNRIQAARCTKNKEKVIYLNYLKNCHGVYSFYLIVPVIILF